MNSAAPSGPSPPARRLRTSRRTVGPGESFWEAGPAPGTAPALTGQAQADVAIVGGGFSGLSAAYHLLAERPDLDVVVLESGHVGAGASGRNTGILRPGVAGTILDLCRRFGDEEAARLYRASVDAVHGVRDLVRREAIGCDLEDVPHVKLALDRRQAEHAEEEAGALDRLGFAARYHDADSLARLVPVPARGGVAYPDAGQLNPALLCRELKRVVVGRGGRIFERTPVTSFTTGRQVRLESPGGVLVARRAVVATNAHAPQLGVLAGQVVPVQTHVSVTAPLSEAQLATLPWEGRSSFSDKRHVFDYYRLTSDNRIMFGGGRPAYRAAPGDRRAGRTDVADPAAWRAQRRLLARVFPTLGDVALDGQWAGTVGMTLDRLPVVGVVADAPGVIFAGAWNGHGVAMATVSGALVADLLIEGGAPSSSTPAWPWVRNRAPALPPDPVRSLGLSAYLTGMQLLDRLDATFERLASRTTSSPVTRIRA